MLKPQIIKCSGREILDSRGNPTVEATVVLSDGTVGVASVPSGASTGIYEAVERRDVDKARYGGRGVLSAVDMICRHISPEIVGMYATEQSALDKALCVNPARKCGFDMWRYLNRMWPSSINFNM